MRLIADKKGNPVLFQKEIEGVILIAMHTIVYDWSYFGPAYNRWSCEKSPRETFDPDGRKVLWHLITPQDSRAFFHIPFTWVDPCEEPFKPETVKSFRVLKWIFNAPFLPFVEVEYERDGKICHWTGSFHDYHEPWRDLFQHE